MALSAQPTWIVEPVPAADLAAMVAGITELRPLVAKKSADETVNNSATLQNDDHLVISVLANASYIFSLLLRYSTNSTANLKWSLTVPSGLLVYSALHAPAGGSALTLSSMVNSDVGTADDSTGYVNMSGVFDVGGTPGDLRLQWAQNTANVSNTIVASYSCMVLQRIA